MRWDLAGTALQEWNDTLLPLLQSIMENNAREIYRGENIADPLIIRLCYMLGCDRLHAHPTIILACDERRFKPILKRTVRVIHRFNEFADKGFKLQPALVSDLEFKANLTACSAGFTSSMRSQTTPGPLSLCGQQIFVNNTERLATIGGTIIIDGSYYALTVAHPFLETSCPTTSSRQSSKVELFTMEWALGSDDESEDKDPTDLGYESAHSECSNGMIAISVISQPLLSLEIITR